jgi:hypothetical protein
LCLVVDNSTGSGELGESLVVDGTQVVDGFSRKNLKAWYFNQGGGRSKEDQDVQYLDGSIKIWVDRKEKFQKEK